MCLLQIFANKHTLLKLCYFLLLSYLDHRDTFFSLIDIHHTTQRHTQTHIFFFRSSFFIEETPFWKSLDPSFMMSYHPYPSHPLHLLYMNFYDIIIGTPSYSLSSYVPCHILNYAMTSHYYLSLSLSLSCHHIHWLLLCHS